VVEHGSGQGGSGNRFRPPPRPFFFFFLFWFVFPPAGPMRHPGEWRNRQRQRDPGWGPSQDDGRSLLLGSRTFAKVCPGDLDRLGDGSGLAVTVARVRDARARDIQNLGIAPIVFWPSRSHSNPGALMTPGWRSPAAVVDLLDQCP